MKAIEVKYNWLRDLKDDKECEFIHLDTKFQKADLFTKQIDFKDFDEQLILLYNVL